MITRSKRLFWFGYWFLVVVLVICALMVALLRVTYPKLPLYQEVIESQLSEMLGEDVSIGGMKAYWRGQSPVLELSDFQVEGKNSVRVKHAILALNLPKSMAYQQLVFDQLEIDQATVHIQSDSTVSGKLTDPIAFDESKRGGLLSLLMRQQQIDIHQLHITYQHDGLPALDLSDISAQLSTVGRSHRLKILGALRHNEYQSPFQFIAEVNGSPRSQPVNFYLSLPKLDQRVIAPWVRMLTESPLNKLQASQQLWGAFRKDSLQYLYAKTSVDTLDIGEQRLSDMTLVSSLRHHGSGYQARVEGALDANGKSYELPVITADWRAILHGMPDKVALESIDLDQLAQWLDAQPFLPEVGQRVLRQLKPAGYLENLTLRWQSDQLNSFVVDADLVNVAVAPWGGAPGVKGVTGRFQQTVNGGFIDLDTTNYQMHFPELEFPAWQYHFARGRVQWHMANGAVEVSSGLLQLKNREVTASGRMFLRIPFDHNLQTDLALLIGVRDSQGVAFKEYIPPKPVGYKTYEWLMHAIQGGKVRTGGFMLSGNTRTRLPDFQKPVVQLFIDVDQLQFGFDKDWPSVTQGKGYFFYRDHGFLVEAKGALLDSEVTEAWIYHGPKEDELRVLGAANGDALDIRRILMETPIRKGVGDAITDWDWAGKALTNVDVTVSLSKKYSPAVEASTKLSAGRLVSVKHRLSFEGIRGGMSFSTRSGLQSSGLSGKLFGHAVKGRIETKDHGGRGLETTVTLDGIASMAQVRSWLDQSYLSVTKGTAEYQAILQICVSNPACNRLIIHSDLVGIDVEAPLPLAKTSDTKKGFDLLLTLTESEKQQLWINYGDALRGVFELGEGGVKRAQLILGGGAPELPEQDGLWIDGNLQSLDINEFSQFLRHAGFLDSSASTESVLTVKDVHLKIKKVTSGSFVLNNMDTRIQQATSGWLFTGSNTLLQGSLFMPNDSKQIARLELDRLNVVYDTAEKTRSGSNTQEPFKPSELPQIDVYIQDLHINEKSLGEWQVEMRPDESGVALQSIQGDMFGIKVTGNASWATDGREQSIARLEFEGKNLSPLLERWGYGKLIESQYLEITTDFNWLGAPWDFGLAQLNGHFKLLVKDGRIIDAGKSGDFLRVLGILNLETVARRLRLDFSDLYKQGLAFDRISADYTIASGVAQTNEPFQLKGPSADMTLSGQLDFVNETVDKDMEVVLPVTKNLPIMGVLLGQPQIAGAVYLIDKLIGSKLEKFTTIRYHLSGDWGDPQLELSPHPAENDVPSAEGRVDD